MCALCEVLNHNNQQPKRCNNETINQPQTEGKPKMLKVENMKSPATGREVANQFILTDTDSGKTTFQSYDSMIVEIDDSTDTITVGKDWRYGPTTSKYRNEFMKLNFFQSIATTEQFEQALKDGKAYTDGSGYQYKVVLLDE